MNLALKSIWSSLVLGAAAGLLGCSESPGPCEFELTFDSTRDGSTEVYAMDLDSLAVRQITDFSEPDIANRFPDWSPDGREIVFVSEDRSGIGDLYIVAADGSDLRRLTSDAARYENPDWAPEGDWIAFEKAKGDDWGLYLVRTDGSELQRIEGKNLYHPSWSPDGERLAIVTGDEPAWFGAVLRLDGAELRRFTPDGLNVGSVRWSPGGTKIAFDAVTGTNLDLFITDEAGSNLQRWTESPAIDARPEWSPDGTELVFHSTRDFGSVHGDGRWDHFELYLLDLETRKIKRLTRNVAFDAHPDWCNAP